MQTIYHVKDAEKIDALIGDCKETEVRAAFDKNFTSLRTKRIGKAKIKFHIRDYDGRDFTLMLCLKTGNIELVRPYMKGSDFEVTLVQQLWQTVSRLTNAAWSFHSDPLPEKFMFDADLVLLKC